MDLVSLEQLDENVYIRPRYDTSGSKAAFPPVDQVQFSNVFHCLRTVCHVACDWDRLMFLFNIILPVQALFFLPFYGLQYSPQRQMLNIHYQMFFSAD